MYFREIKYSENFTLDELKYCTAYYLSSIDRNDDATHLLNINYDMRPDIMSALNIGENECTGLMGKRYFTQKYFKTHEEIKKYNEYIIQFTLNSSPASVLLGFLDTKLGEDFISNKLYREFGTQVSKDKVLAILEIFKEETVKSYAQRYKEEGHPAAYLSNAFGYFIKGKKIQIANIINQGSITIGEEQKDLNQIKNESVQNVKTDYDIPNFTELVRNIYEGSKAVKYKLVEYTLVDKNTEKECVTSLGKIRKKANPLGIIAYDIFSCVKYLILRSRIDDMLKDRKYSYAMNNISRLRFKPMDVNKEGYYESENDYSYRNYTSRRSVIELIIKNINVADNHEFFRLFYNNDIEGDDDKNNTKILTRDKSSFNQDIKTFKSIVKGVKSALSLVGELMQNGIDPLTVPSEIFRDPAWLHRAKSLKEYLELYDNVLELEVNNLKVCTNGELLEEEHIGLRFNKTLNQFITEKLKQDIASITTFDLKQALSLEGFSNSNTDLYELVTTLNPTNIARNERNTYNLFLSFKRRIEQRYRDYKIKCEDIRRFVFAMEYFTNGFENPYIVRVAYSKPENNLLNYARALQARNEANAILDALNKNKTFIYPVTEQDKERLKHQKYPERIFNWSKLSFEGFFGNVNKYRGYTPRSDDELKKFNYFMRTLSNNTLAIYDRDIRIRLIRLKNELENSLKDINNLKRVELDAGLLGYIGVTDSVIRSQNLKTQQEIYKYVYTVLCNYLNIVNVYPVYDRNNGFTFDGKNSIDKEIVTTPLIEWYSKPDDFDDICQKIIERARTTNNVDLYGVLSRVVGYLHSVENSPKPDYFTLLTTQLRELSIILFIREKLDAIFKRLADYYLNDIEFVDIITICKDFIIMLDNGIKYEELVKFDTRSFAEKFSHIERPCKYEDLVLNQPLYQWESANKNNTVTRSIMTCMPKRAGLGASAKMQNACTKAYVLFKEEISFLKMCVDLVQHEEINLDGFKKAQTHGKHDLLMRYAAYIRAYPDKIQKFKNVGTQRLLNTSSYTLYENEYIMSQGVLVTKKFNNRIYYLHKTGVYVTPELNIGDINWILSYMG